MLTFFIGLFTGTVVGVVAMCIIITGRAHGRLEAEAASNSNCSIDVH